MQKNDLIVFFVELKKKENRQMMKIKNITSELLASHIEIQGWVRTRRRSGKKKHSIIFIDLNDGSCQTDIQIVFQGSQFDDVYQMCKSGAAVKIGGQVVKSQGAQQSIEIAGGTCILIGDVDDPETYPIAGTDLTLEYLRQLPHLRIRTPIFSALARIKSCLKLAMAEYFESQGFFEVQVPCITDNECESGCDALQVTSLISDGKISSIPEKDGQIDFDKDFLARKRF